MIIRIKTFSSVKDLLGFNNKEIIVQDAISVGEMFNRLSEDVTEVKLLRDKLLFAVNEEYCNDSRILQDNDLLAIFPPVSGG